MLVSISLAMANPSAFLGPDGCWESDGTVEWSASPAAWSGVATTRGHFETHGWALQGWTVHDESPRRAHAGEARFAPLMVGTHVDAPLAYFVTRRRWLLWPAPVTTEPLRMRGETAVAFGSLSSSGTSTQDHAVAWRGYATADRHRQVRVTPDGRIERLAFERQTRRRGCRIVRRGEATLGEVGLPVEEHWTTQTRCGLRRQTLTWRFSWRPWTRCQRSMR